VRANPIDKLTVKSELVFNEPDSKETRQQSQTGTVAGTELKNSDACIRLEVTMLLEHALMRVGRVTDLHHKLLLGVEVGDGHVHDFVQNIVGVIHPARIISADGVETVNEFDDLAMLAIHMWIAGLH